MPGNDGAVNLGSAYGDVRIDYSQVNDDLNKALAKVERDLGAGLTRVGESLQRVGRDLTIATAPISGFILKGVLAFASLDEVLTEISARTGATAAEMEKVRQVALQLGQDTKFSSVEASQGILELLASGQSLEEAFSTIPHVLDLAAAGNISLGEAASTVTTILAQFKLRAEDSEEVVNLLNAAAASSKAEIGDMAQAFENVGPIAANFGLDVEDTAAILAVFAQNGILGAEAGTQLKSMLTNMSRPTNDVQGMWKKLNVSMFDAQGNMRDINTIIADLNVAMADMTQQERIETIQTLAGSYGQVGLSALLASGGISQMEIDMANAATASEVAAERSNSFNGKIEQLSGSLETLSINVIGPLVEKYLEPLIASLTETVNVVNEWVLANPELAAQIAIIAGLIAGLGPVLIVAGLAISAIGTAIGFILSPIGLVIAAVIALGAAYATNFMGIRDAVNNAVDWIIPKLQSIYDWFVTDALPAITLVVNDFKPILQGFVDGLVALWEVAQPFLKDLFDWFVNKGLPFIGAAIVAAIIGLHLFIETLKRLWTDVEPKLIQLYQWFNETGLPIVRAAIDRVKQAINELIERAGRIWDATSGAWNAFKTNVLGVVSALSVPLTDLLGTINDIITGMDKVKSGGPLSVIAGMFGKPFAEGGDYPAGMPRLVGERGVELEVPRSSGMIVAGDQLRTAMNVLAGKFSSAVGGLGSGALAGAGGGGGSGNGLSIQQVVVNVTTAPGADGYEQGREAGRGFGEQLMELMRSKG